MGRQKDSNRNVSAVVLKFSRDAEVRHGFSPPVTPKEAARWTRDKYGQSTGPGGYAATYERVTNA